jgi:MoxR-like ATPase
MTQAPGLKKPLYEFLRENEFYIEKHLAELLEKVLLMERKGVLLRGPAGVGKTQLTYLIAKYLDAEYVFYQCTYGTSEDDLLYKYIPSEQTKSGIRVTLGPLPRALVLSKQKRVVLVLDEFDKTRLSADALLLDVLQNFRVALYLDDNETIVRGNAGNLVVFLTSNDMREFSEPLLRRVVAITLKPLPTQKVLEILSKKFKKEVALLLAQIYDDTINANLRKPATLQELYQLGEILESSPNIPLDDLIKMFIVKYDDDYVKYKQYVTSRKMLDFLDRIEKKQDEVAKYYEPPEREIEIQPQQQAEANTTSSASQVLEKIAKVVVRQPRKIVEAREDVKEDIETTFKAPINENNVDIYTAIVKRLRPEPSDTGDVVGKFRVIKHGAETILVSNEPLSLSEYVKLLSGANEKFEAYIEERVFLLNPVTIDNMLHHADNIYYYSNRIIRVEKRYENSSELVEVELVGDSYSPRREKVTLVEAIVRAYVSIDPNNRQPLILREVMPEKVCKATIRDVDEYERIVDKCIETRSLDVKVVSEPQRTNEVISKISKIASDHGFRIRVNISPGEKIRSVGAYIDRENEIIIYSPDW